MRLPTSAISPKGITAVATTFSHIFIQRSCGSHSPMATFSPSSKFNFDMKLLGKIKIAKFSHKFFLSGFAFVPYISHLVPIVVLQLFSCIMPCFLAQYQPYCHINFVLNIKGASLIYKFTTFIAIFTFYGAGQNGSLK